MPYLWFSYIHLNFTFTFTIYPTLEFLKSAKIAKIYFKSREGLAKKCKIKVSPFNNWCTFCTKWGRGEIFSLFFHCARLFSLFALLWKFCVIVRCFSEKVRCNRQNLINMVKVQFENNDVRPIRDLVVVLLLVNLRPL